MSSDNKTFYNNEVKVTSKGVTIKGTYVPRDELGIMYTRNAKTQQANMLGHNMKHFSTTYTMCFVKTRSLASINPFMKCFESESEETNTFAYFNKYCEESH
jgi:fibrillarin-like rRNA methylase